MMLAMCSVNICPISDLARHCKKHVLKQHYVETNILTFVTNKTHNSVTGTVFHTAGDAIEHAHSRLLLTKSANFWLGAGLT